MVTKTHVLEFVRDLTLKVAPIAPGTGATALDTSVLDVSMNNLINPISTTNATGTFTAQSGAIGDSVEGLDDWLGDDGRYGTYCVLGAKLEVNGIAAQGGGGTTINNYALGVHKAANGDTDVTPATQLPDIQQFAFTRQKNGMGMPGTNTQVQAMRFSDTYSAKRWEGVSDVKDNKALHGTLTTAPTEGGKFQIFYASREPVSLKNPPPMLMRVKIKYIVLLSDPKKKNTAL